jgi:hypothetical protein
MNDKKKNIIVVIVKLLFETPKKLNFVGKNIVV